MENAEGMWTYFAILGGLLAAGLGFPIPEELPVVIGGSLAGHAAAQQPREHPHWWLLWPICIIGVVVSDGLLYCLGRFGGSRLLDLPWVRKRLLHPEKREQIEANFHKYGVKILLGARFLPGIRAPIFVMSGVLKMPWTRFLLADGIYAIPGVSLLFFLAFWFTDQFVALVHRLKGQVDGLRPLIVVVLIAGVGGIFLYWFTRRRGVVSGDPHEVPIIGSVVKDPEPEVVDGPDPEPLVMEGRDPDADAAPPANPPAIA